MCVALATIENQKPSLAILRACEAANPHGGGVAWREKNRIHWQKGLSADEIHALIQDKTGPFLIHFRIATVGNVKPELCHPFPVGGNASIAVRGDASAVIAHNGTWSAWKEVIKRASKSLRAKLPEGPMSDSRAMAWLVSHVGERAFNHTGYSRFAYFTPKGIKLFGEWDKLNGFYASNLFWRARLKNPLPKREQKGSYTHRRGKSIYDQVCFELQQNEND